MQGVERFFSADHVGENVFFGIIHDGGELGTFGRIWSATARHWALAASGVSWAKAVAMKAETTRRPLLPACASTLRMK